MASDRPWAKHTVKELQKFLKDRGITASGERKASLVDICSAAADVGVTLDPDCLHEDRVQVINAKLQTSSCTLTIPSQIKGTQDISILPIVSIFDIYNYLVRFDDYNHTGLRDYKKMEAYGMFMDGHVKYLSSHQYTESPLYFAVNAHVKPRTKEKDPVSKQGHYNSWIILTTDNNGHSSIFSAYCTCKGGMDGCCRHVATVLFEISEFQNDGMKKSVTSGPCMWVTKAKPLMAAMPATELRTALTEHDRDVMYPTATNLSTIPDGVELPKVQDYHEILRKRAPGACMLDTVEVRKKKKYPEPYAMPPYTKLHIFLSCHSCEDNVVCSPECCEELYTFLQYSDDERKNIETSTQGQHENCHWHNMRKGLLTSSIFKKICSSTNFTKTALALMKGSSIDEERLPRHIEYGRKNEERARTMFLKGHKFIHKKCTITVPGLIISEAEPYIGTSPDGILHCKECKEMLVEVKCLSSNRNFHPKTALVMGKICEKDESGTLKMIETHPYYFQIQGQMAVTCIHKCVLVAFTNKGIACVQINFDSAFWAEVSTKLRKFYEEAYIPVMRAGRTY